MSGALSLRTSYYDALKRLTLELAGVRLGENHEFMVETRLAALARREGFDSLSDLVDELFSRGQTRLAVNVVSVLLERDMRFFEDRSSFKIFEDVIVPQLLPAYKGTAIKILCFGCGTGQDAISAAITLDKLSSRLPDLDFHITGIDYPSQALTRAAQGRFTHFEVQRGLAARDLVTYFKGDKEDWLLGDHLKSKLTFTEHHLLNTLEPLGQFQLIMFRNSIARYSNPAQMRILRSLGGSISPLGYLMMGSQENLHGLNFGLDKVSTANGLFRRPPLPVKPEVEIDDGRKKPTDRKTFEKAKRQKPDSLADGMGGDKRTG